MIRAVVHLANDHPVVVDMLDPPQPGDISLICTNVRTLDGKRPVFIDQSRSTFVFPYVSIRFVEIHQGAASDADEPPERAPAPAAPAEPEDLEIDEDFLRRVREA